MSPRIAAEPCADEHRMLLAFLDYHRETLAMKCAGLTPEQLARRSAPPSSMSLLGLVRHLAEVERGWFDRAAGRERPPLYCDETRPDEDFDGAAADSETVRTAFTDWRAAIAESREVLADGDLDRRFRHAGSERTVRWLLLHMIEEYARHNGHADLLREAIDGSTGE